MLALQIGLHLAREADLVAVVAGHRVSLLLLDAHMLTREVLVGARDALLEGLLGEVIGELLLLHLEVLLRQVLLGPLGPDLLALEDARVGALQGVVDPARSGPGDQAQVHYWEYSSG